MNDSDHSHEVALFRYGLIADLVQLPPGTKGLYRRLEEKAAGEYTIPGTTRPHPRGTGDPARLAQALPQGWL